MVCVCVCNQLRVFGGVRESKEEGMDREGKKERDVGPLEELV